MEQFSTALQKPLMQAASRYWREQGSALADAALVAVGGLARKELCPYSDIDLVVMTRRDLNEDAQERLARAILHPVWDSGLKAQINLRTVDQWLSDAAEDLTACSSILDATGLAGDLTLVQELRERAEQSFFGDRRGEFLERLLDEMRVRHRRFGSTIYMVQPDLKEGPGGARDLAIITWALQSTFQTRDLARLEGESLLGTRAVHALARARSELCRLRTALHLAAKRAQERLVFLHQEQLPRLLGTVDTKPDDAALVSAIEDFMQNYFRSALDVMRHGKRVFLRCTPASVEATPIQRIDDRFYLQGGHLSHSREGVFEARPVLALEALRIARDQRVRLDPATADAMIDALDALDPRVLVNDPRAQRLWMDLLVEPEDTGSPTTLELCHELGLLERLVPEFGPSRGRMQHEGFHVYTVDQHSLFAVDFLKSLARGEFCKNYPLATAVHLGVEDPRVLYLATLLHDAGKAFGDQYSHGMRIAAKAAQRAGLSPESVRDCAFLVNEHTSMPMVSQKRDLSDPLEIENFAYSVGSRRRLDLLYLISLADMANVSPEYLTNWKLALLDELYLVTLTFFARGQREIQRARAVPIDEPQGLPARYYTLFDVAMRREHLNLIEKVGDNEELDGVTAELDGALGNFRLTIVAPDRRGMLALLAGAMEDCGVDVVAADVFSVPGEPTLALDIFRIEARGGDGLALDQEWLNHFESEVRRCLRSDPDLAMNYQPPSRRRFSKPLRREDRCELNFARDPAGLRSIVEVNTHSDGSVLRSVAGVTASLGIDIELARLTTHDNFVELVLYVDKLDPEPQMRLAEGIQQVLSN